MLEFLLVRACHATSSFDFVKQLDVPCATSLFLDVGEHNVMQAMFMSAQTMHKNPSG